MKSFWMAPVAAVALLSGCVAGQSIKLSYTPDPAVNSPATEPVTLVVRDQREYVTNRDKDPWYLGHYRAGFGNTWDVANYGKAPLEDQFRSDLHRELQTLGFTGDAASQNTLTISIREWNFDAATNGRLWYEIRVAVTDRSGRVTAESTIKDQRIIRGSAMTGAKSAMEREVPEIYRDVIRALVRNNATVLAALRPAVSASIASPVP